MTTMGTMIATMTAAVSGDIEFEESVTGVSMGDVAFLLGPRIFVVVFTDAVQRRYQRLLLSSRSVKPACRGRCYLVGGIYS